MTISSSLNAGVMGLNVNATRLATISDNIANSGTYGYKRSDVDFSSLVIDQGASQYSAGGVRATNYREVTSTGSIVSSANATDITVDGNGMIPVTNLTGVSQNAGERDFMMVPTGGFSPDENGFLRTSSGLFLLGWPTNGNGEVENPSRGSTAGLQPVNTNIGVSAEATRNINLGVNLPADTAGSTDPFVLPIDYYDSLGLGQSATMSFEPDTTAGAPPNSWNVSITDSAGDPATPVASFNVIFNGQTNGGSIASITAGAGTTYDAGTGQISFDVEGGPMNAFIGSPNGDTGLSQLGTSFSPYDVSKDGFPVGDVQSVEVTEDGFVEAVYNTGFRRTIYQIPVADVPNPNGMKALGNQAYTTSANSGDIYLWDAGDGPTGTYKGYSLMESNTDVASELTALIETQRAYSSNAKIIQTVDEMLQETTNLKR